MNDLVMTAVVGVAAFAVSCFGGWPLVSGVLRIAQRPTNQDQSSQIHSQPALRGGVYIGILERAATTAAIMAGQPALIAVVVAVKGFGRFDQLKGNPVASEKFTIGTLLSLLWAVGIGAAATAVMGYLRM